MAARLTLIVGLVTLASANGKKTHHEHHRKSNDQDHGDSKSEKGGLLSFLKKHGKKHELAPCTGDTRFKNKAPICQHLGFRFCTRMLTDDSKPFMFDDRKSEKGRLGDKNHSTERKEDVNKDGLDWWEWSGQGKSKKPWIKGIEKTGGTHWCTCAECTAEAVDRFGCDALDIQCNATDVAFIRYRVEHDHHNVLKSGWECLKKKCGEDYQKDFPIVGHDCKHRGCARLYGAGYENALMPFSDSESHYVGTNLVIATFVGSLVGLVGGLSLWSRRRSATSGGHSLLVVEEDAGVLTEGLE